MVNKSEMFLKISNLISSEEYKSISVEITKRTNKILCNDIYDAEIEYCEKILDASKVSIDEVRKKIKDGEDKFLNYCIAYISIESSLEQGQEYNESEIPVEDEPANEKYVGHSQTFLFQNAVFYLVLEGKEEFLMDFLKRIKKPHAKKFSTSLRRFFLNLKNE